jgi:hypothetical protein
METNLPQIVAIQCNSGCVYPVGELLFKAVELIYWNDIRHLERLDLLRAKTGHEVEAENRAYLDNVKLLKATLDEAVRRYKRDDGFHPNG